MKWNERCDLNESGLIRAILLFQFIFEWRENCAKDAVEGWQV